MVYLVCFQPEMGSIVNVSRVGALPWTERVVIEVHIFIMHHSKAVNSSPFRQGTVSLRIPRSNISDV
jgi:hypothetical protein